VTEGDDVGAQAPRDFVDGAAAVAAAQVASVLRLLFEQAHRSGVTVTRPRHPALSQPRRQRLQGSQELALLHGEGAHGELHRSALLKQPQDFQQGE